MTIDASKIPMSDTRSKFIAAGWKLYSERGYHKLSVRALAAEAGLSPGMFHHLFENKDAFFAEMLAYREEATWRSIDVETLPEHPFACLQRLLYLLAVSVRDDLHQAQRLLADSAGGVEVVNAFVRSSISRRVERLAGVLDECARLDNSCPATLTQRLSYLSGSVIAPILVGSSFADMGVLPETLRQGVPDLLDDASVHQRISWSIGALFPRLAAQQESL